jgi:hypothetical protein
MAVPWSGFPMVAFVDFAKPLGLKYVQMETFFDPRRPQPKGSSGTLALCRGRHSLKPATSSRFS